MCPFLFAHVWMLCTAKSFLQSNVKTTPCKTLTSAYICITLNTKDVNMVERKNIPKLQITPRKYTAASTVVSMRIPRDMLQALDDAAERAGRTRNELISLVLEFALEHLDIPQTTQKREEE